MLRQRSQKLRQADASISLSQFGYVREWNDEFLKLFPHRDDYLWAEHPIAGTSPIWQTESSHPLSDRQIQQGTYLFGVRFDSLTHYLMLDIDPTSAYHPSRDPFAIDNILATLEPLGLVAHVAIRSSSRTGIHLYFPFEEAQKSWAIARAAAILLANQGFTVSSGQLELFPNPKPYSNTPTLYNGHRLPLQPGSYLLNQEWEPIYSTPIEFVSRWKFAQNRNDVSHKTIEQILKESQRQAYRRLRTGGQKYLNDLNTDIEPGWTAAGQTNFLLGKIANRERVFHHILWGGEPLQEEDLARAIAQVARSLPGFEEFCNHQAELNQKAMAWARSAIQRYYPYSHGKISSQRQSQEEKKTEPSWNQKQAQDARERITRAIADLLNQQALPAQATARRHAIRAYGVGNKTLDKNRDLWHPDYIEPVNSVQYHPAEKDLHLSEHSKSLPEAEYHSITPNKLEGVAASNAPQEQFESSPSINAGGSGGFSTDNGSQSSQNSQERTPQGIEWVQLALAQIQLRKKQMVDSEADQLNQPNLEIKSQMSNQISSEISSHLIDSYLETAPTRSSVIETNSIALPTQATDQRSIAHLLGNKTAELLKIDPDDHHTDQNPQNLKSSKIAETIAPS